MSKINIILKHININFKIKNFLYVFFLLIILQNFYTNAATCSINSCNSKNCNTSCSNYFDGCQCNTCDAQDSVFSYWGKTFFQPRSQNTNTARRAVGNHNFRHRFDEKKNFVGSLTVTPEYNQSFKPYHIAEYFFSSDVLNFTGSMVNGRASNNILADYFGLSPEFQGSIAFKPQIKSFITDFNLMLEFKKGVYFQVYSPLVNTRWQMQMCNNTNDSGSSTPFPAGYMAEGAITAPVNSISKALEGNVSFGDVIEGIKYGKFSCCQLKTTKLADITFLLGWIFLNRDSGYVGVNAQLTAPTGTRPENKYIFEPIAGNGHHWEFGIGFTGEVELWAKDNDQRINLHFDANFGNLIHTCQHRSFDFKCNKFLSRYMLLKEFDQDGNYLQLVPAINVTTLKCNVKANFQMDLNLMAAYYNKNWEFDFGYNGWLRSHEEITLIDKIPDNTYALKGIQDVGGLNANITQSNATIYGNPFDQQTEVADTDSPVFLCTSNLDICSAANPKVLTHKFYTHLNHKWEKENRSFSPYLGAGSQIEFESINPRVSYPDKNTLYQWSLWLKAGLAYN
jgi:hypothetical protein